MTLHRRLRAAAAAPDGRAARALLLVALLSWAAERSSRSSAWVPAQAPGGEASRRSLLAAAAAQHAAGLAAAAPLLAGPGPARAQAGTPLDDGFQGTPEEQVRAARRTVDALQELECWETLDCDGDEIRRYLGTVGTKSPLFKLEPALKKIYAEIDDEKAPDLEELMQHVRESDYLAYSTIFAIFSGGKDPKPIAQDCRNQITKLQKDLMALEKLLPS